MNFIKKLFVIASGLRKNTPLVVAPSGDLVNLVNDRMKTLENEQLTQRLKSMEKIVKHLTFEIQKQNDMAKLNHDLMLYLTQTVEELLNQIPSDESYAAPEEQSNDEELNEAWQHVAPAAGKLDIN